MSQVVLNVAGSVLIVLCALIANASVYVHSRVRWWATEMGRHLMAYMVTMALILDLSTISVFARLFGYPTDAVWFQLLRLGVFLALPAVMSQRLWLQIKAQRNPNPPRLPK